MIVILKNILVSNQNFDKLSYTDIKYIKFIYGLLRI